jgi:sulfatase maturation enzyme AslB (radical SAM superfamily)
MIECKNLTNGLRIATSGAYFTCCHTFNYPYKDENGNILSASTHTVDDAMNSHTRQEMLVYFQQGKRHPACKVCWDAEDAGFVSKRQRDNETFKMFPHRNNDDLFFLELNLGNTCNLACRICHVSASSRWRNFHHVTEPNVTEEQLDEYVAKFSKSFTDDSIVWDELGKILPKVRTVDIYGGEPMLMKKQWEILEMCVEKGYAKNQQMSFNTNGTIINDRYVQILSSFEQCRIGFSLDGVGKRFNYLRYYADWDSVKSNVSSWKEKTKNSTNQIFFEVCSTISVLNVLYVFEIVDYVTENDLTLYVAFVHNPKHLHIGYIPNDIKLIIIDKLTTELNRRTIELNNNTEFDENQRAYRKRLLYQAEKVINMLKLENPDNDPQPWKDFIRQTNELDDLRNESFAETFPELEELYQVKKHKVPQNNVKFI